MDVQLYDELALATRLRHLAEGFFQDADKLNERYGSPIRSAQFYVIYALAQKGPLSMTDIAALSGFTHSAVSQTVKKLRDDNVVTLSATDDGRQKLIELTQKGQQGLSVLEPLWNTVRATIQDMVAETGVDVMAGLNRLETMLKEKGLYDRVMAHKIDSVADRDIELTPYDIRYKDAFKNLNYEWLEQYFEIEPIDKQSLGNPDSFFLNEGGEIWFALVDGQPLGTFALKHYGAGVFEFTKYAVHSSAQGLGLGGKLMRCATNRFQARGGKKLFLETNTILENARQLYLKYGWVDKEPAQKSPYARANSYMVWTPDLE